MKMTVGYFLVNIVVGYSGFSHYYVIRRSIHKWINSWLSGRTHQVVLDGQSSDPVPVFYNVPKGSVLGPILIKDNIRSSVRG